MAVKDVDASWPHRGHSWVCMLFQGAIFWVGRETKRTPTQFGGREKDEQPSSCRAGLELHLRGDLAAALCGARSEDPRGRSRETRFRGGPPFLFLFPFSGDPSLLI